MADNIAVTEGSGKTVATDDISGIQYQRVKVVLGADGVNDGDVSSSNALPVSAASLPLPTGASTAAKQPALGTAGTPSSDVITIQGVSSMTAVKVDNSAVTQPVAGTTASGSSLSSNPVTVGGRGSTALPTAVSDGQVVNTLMSKTGKIITRNVLYENLGNQQTTITSSTSETTIVTADATYKLMLYGLVLTNTSASATKVTIKDATSGTTRFVFQVPATETRGFMLPPDCGHKQATANNNWTATCGTSVASLEVTALYAQEG